MAKHEFDPGYVDEPFRSLVEDYPGAETYPAADFRVEWGPVFHRGRLDGSARVVVIGQDPAQHEVIARRILVGAAGQRAQGFLAKLGLERSYVYSVYGQGGGSGTTTTRRSPATATAGWTRCWSAPRWRRWSPWDGWPTRRSRAWRETPAGQQAQVAYRRITHPTAPESASGGDPDRYDQAVAAMLESWNEGLEGLRPAIRHPDVDRDLVPYGERLESADYAPIPERDLPAGLPAWMRSRAWADRVGATATLKRATIVVTVPRDARPWER